VKALDHLADVFLLPGEFFVGDARYKIRTMLGSCVSITLWHPIERIGAMSHFLLPTRGLPDHRAARDGRYGDEALALMLDELRLFGVSPKRCEAKIFGGGNMFPDQMHAKSLHVGQRNGEAAIALMHAHGIPIVSESLFGVGHRQIIFNVTNGDVWSHQVEPAAHALKPRGDLF
jgi:chemotaxis protein CheD